MSAVDPGKMEKPFDPPSIPAAGRLHADHPSPFACSIPVPIPGDDPDFLSMNCWCGEFSMYNVRSTVNEEEWACCDNHVLDAFRVAYRSATIDQLREMWDEDPRKLNVVEVVWTGDW